MMQLIVLILVSLLIGTAFGIIITPFPRKWTFIFLWVGFFLMITGVSVFASMSP